MMEKILKINLRLVLLGGFLLAGTMRVSAAEAPARPTGLEHRLLDGQPLLAWDPVAGALLYRVAVFGPMQGKKAGDLKAAVWVDVTRWHYGEDPYIPKAGNWVSTLPKKLEAGKKYKWIVSAAVSGEKDKGLAAGATFTLPLKEKSKSHEVLLDASKAQTKTPTPTATVSPQPALSATPTPRAVLSPTPQPGEFTEGGDLESIDFGEQENIEERAQPSHSRADALLQDKKFKEAAEEYRKILALDKNNSDAWEGLGDSYKAQRLKLEAVEAYETALKIDPKRKHLKKWIKSQRRW